MIELRVLGPVTLRGPDQREIVSILAQPKRLALLTYLAVHGRYGYLRKDTLLALFWPELDQRHARGALRNALYFLRERLGSGVLLAQGDDQVGLDAHRLWCDAAEFDRALRHGDYHTASRLDHGELLEGVYVAWSPPFDQWLEGQRLQFRMRTQALAMASAKLHAAAGRFDAALTCARRAEALEPLSEEVARMVISLLDRLGDRAAALKAYDRLASLLREEYDVSPSVETRRLVTRIRERVSGEVAVTGVVAGAVADAPAPPTAADVRLLADGPPAGTRSTCSYPSVFEFSMRQVALPTTSTRLTTPSRPARPP